MPAPLVFTHPDQLSQSARANVQTELRRWDADGRTTPVILEGGARLTTIATLTVSALLHDGPLAGMRFQVALGDLTDLPESFEWTGGRYQRWVTETGDQYISTDGGPTYLWEPV